MSEQLPHTTELLPAHTETVPEQQGRLEKLQDAGRQAEQDHLSKSLELLQKRAEMQSVSGKEIAVGDRQENDDTPVLGLQKELKQQAYLRTMQKVQSRLSGPERVFSRVIHTQVVNALSEAGARSIGRPSGLMGGALCALLGSSLLLYVAKHYGFTYNYTVILVLFIGGFIVGLLIELLYRLVAKARS